MYYVRDKYSEVSMGPTESNLARLARYPAFCGILLGIWAPQMDITLQAGRTECRKLNAERRFKEVRATRGARIHTWNRNKRSMRRSISLDTAFNFLPIESFH